MNNPNKIDQIFDNFNSMSYLGRRAAKAIKQYYIKEKQKTNFYDMSKGYSNYFVYASEVSEISKDIKKKTKQKIEKLELKKE